MGVGIENAGGDFLHKATHEFENYETDSDNNKHYDDIARGEKDEFKEIANKRNGEGGSHNTNDSDEEAGAEFVEGPRDPVDEDEVDSEGDEDGDGGELGVRKALEVRDDREGGHAERNGNANWERVGEDVFSEVVFDAIGVMLESEDKARKADTGEIKKRHFNRGEGVLHREKDKNDGENRGIDGLGKKESSGTLEVIDGLAAFVYDAGDGRKIGAQENHFGAATGGIGTFADSKTNVGLFHGQNIIDTVAGHGDSVSLFPKRGDEIFFLGRLHASKNIIGFD